MISGERIDDSVGCIPRNSFQSQQAKDKATGYQTLTLRFPLFDDYQFPASHERSQQNDEETIPGDDCFQWRSQLARTEPGMGGAQESVGGQRWAQDRVRRSRQSVAEHQCGMASKCRATPGRAE